MNPFRLSSRLSATARSAGRPGAREAEREPGARGAPGAVRGRLRPLPDRGPGADRDPDPDPSLDRAPHAAPGAEAVAVAVPWRVTVRSRSGVIEVEQCGESPLHAVRFSLAGGGMLGLSLPRTVLPGERVRVVLRGRSADGALAAGDAVLVLRWFQPDGRELLWPISV